VSDGPGRPGRRRRRHLVLHALQLRFISVSIALIVAGFAGAAWLALHAVRQALEEALYRSHITWKNTAEIIIPPLLEANLLAIAAMLTLTLLLIAAIRKHYLRQLQTIADRLTAVAAGLPAPPTETRPAKGPLRSILQQLQLLESSLAADRSSWEQARNRLREALQTARRQPAALERKEERETLRRQIHEARTLLEATLKEYHDEGAGSLELPPPTPPDHGGPP
jgi:hypothetical protein